jgi:uncharacterized repeat protein (TIGR02543 family)
MIGQTSGNDLRRRRAGRLAGALGLLLALALMAGGVLPAYADGPPTWPHVFYGTVSTFTPAGPVPEGTLVQAFVGTALGAETTTDAESNYFLKVQGSGGGTVTFKVAGVMANQTAVFQSGEATYLDLTIAALPGVAYNLTMAVAPADTGTATDVTNTPPYAEGVAVSIKAVPATGYHFSHWTAAPAVVFGNADAAETTFTMPAADVTVTANFEEGVLHTLTMAVSPLMGGTATDVTGASSYLEDEVVNILAVAASGYQFVGWTATAGAFSNANAESTIFQMPDADVIVTANFEVAGGSSCFIATAAYGNPTAEQIDVLREFRDVVLLESTAGSQFVALYYKLSPPVADFISGSSLLRTLVRVLLVDPVVGMVEATGGIWRK